MISRDKETRLFNDVTKRETNKLKSEGYHGNWLVYANSMMHDCESRKARQEKRSHLT